MFNQFTSLNCFCLIISLLTANNLQAGSVSSPILSSQQITVNQLSFSVLSVKTSAINLHWKIPNSIPYNNTIGNPKKNRPLFNAFSYLKQLKKHLETQNKQVFALMNAGIYSSNYTPSGLHIEQSKVLKPLNTKKGKGNFHLRPNGIFYISKNNTANILSTQQFKKQFKPPYHNIRLATQSGPILIIDGEINPILKADSQSLYIRNGICIDKQYQVKWIISSHSLRQNNKSNLYTFAKAMKKSGCKQGLYLDGSISRLYQKNDYFLFHWRPFVGILSVTSALPKLSKINQ